MTYSQLITYIQQYDSDTFPNLPLSRKRAGKMAQKFIEYFVENKLDGCLLSDWFDQTREEKK